MVTRSAPGKRRPGRLHAQRGAAVFIVVMVLTLLTAVGIFAVRSTSLADIAAGYDREASQAALVAQYGTRAAAAFLATTGGSTVVGQMKSNTYCQTNMGLSAPCFKLTSGLIESTTLTQGNENLFETSSSSLNFNGKTTADFMLELTDASRSGKLSAGDTHSPIQVTVTAIAQVQQAGACVAGVGQTWNAGQQMMRALISAGNQ